MNEKCNHIWRESFLVRRCELCGAEQRIDILVLIEMLEEYKLLHIEYKVGVNYYNSELKMINEIINILNEVKNGGLAGGKQ